MTHSSQISGPYLSPWDAIVVGTLITCRDESDSLDVNALLVSASKDLFAIDDVLDEWIRSTFSFPASVGYSNLPPPWITILERLDDTLWQEISSHKLKHVREVEDNLEAFLSRVTCLLYNVQKVNGPESNVVIGSLCKFVNIDMWHPAEMKPVGILTRALVYGFNLIKYSALERRELMETCRPFITYSPLDVALNYRGMVERMISLTSRQMQIESMSILYNLLQGDAVDISFAVTRFLDDPATLRNVCQTSGSLTRRLLDVLDDLLDHAKHHKILEKGKQCGTLQAILLLSRRSGTHPTYPTLVGLQMDGDYPVAAGGYSDVWRGQLSGAEVCVKVVKVYQQSDIESLLKGIAREAIIWRHLHHPNVLPFYGVHYLNEDRSRVCLVSPWMKHGNLTEFIKKNSMVDRSVLAMDLARGLNYLHSEGIVHADLKGANILITDDQHACIADFGLSLISESRVAHWSSLSTIGSRGTCRWQAPELFSGASNTRASDIYAFACVLYETFCGTLPFSELNGPDTVVMFAVLQGRRPERPENCYELNDSIWTLMNQCWDPLPAGRPTAEQALISLQAVTAHESISQSTNDDDRWNSRLRTSLTPFETSRILCQCTPNRIDNNLTLPTGGW